MLILKSIDGGQTWARISSIIGLPPKLKYTKIDQISCSKNTCVIAGSYHAYDNFKDKRRVWERPFLLTSRDQGNSWNMIQKIGNAEIDLMPGEVQAIKCLNDGKTCLAGGVYINGELIFWKSIDQGATWSALDTYTDIKKGGIFSISCSEKICLAAGGSADFNIPLLLISDDYSASWTLIKSIKNIPPYTNLTQVHCEQNQCHAVGLYKTNDDSTKWLPLLLTSDDLGATWFYTDINHLLPADIDTGRITAIQRGHRQ